MLHKTTVMVAVEGVSQVSQNLFGGPRENNESLKCENFGRKSELRHFPSEDKFGASVTLFGSSSTGIAAVCLKKI
jgi:hypothetical protein